MKILSFISLVLLLTACHPHPPREKEKGKAIIAPLQSTSKVKGVVTFEETEKGLKVHADIQGLPPGKHGFHIHEFGDVGNEGKAAGGHYNPDKVKHGLLANEGFKQAHAGDFGNISADQEGNGTLDLLVPGLKLSHGPYPIAGRAIIIHEKEDDFSQPVGNAGSRIGGGAIIITTD